jgi:hypothetical protein
VVTEGFLGTFVHPLALVPAIFKSIKTRENACHFSIYAVFYKDTSPCRENRIIQSCKTVNGGYGNIELESFISEFRVYPALDIALTEEL